MLALIIEKPEYHVFLRDSFDDMYDETFSMEPVHEHCAVERVTGQFEDTLSRAESDHLGAYSRNLRSATWWGLRRIRKTFGAIGDYCAFELMRGTAPDCAVCKQHNHHLFTNWFFGVAWDWCFLVTWPSKNVLWLGCLTDTD